MELYDSTKSIVENLYFLSGPLLAFFGMMILFQVYYAKKSIKLAKSQLIQAKEHLKTISQREAATIAAERINFFTANIIPIGDNLYKERKKINFPLFNGKIDSFKHKEIQNWDLDFKKSFLEHGLKNPKILGQELINNLEGFSAYFTNGIANEKIAFSSVGTAFCSYVEKYYPFICLMQNSTNVNNPYCNIIELYGMWKNRMKIMESELLLKKEEAIVIEKIKELEEMKIKSNEIEPLGTK